MKISDIDDYFIELRDKINMSILYIDYSKHERTGFGGDMLELDDDLKDKIKVIFYSNTDVTFLESFGGVKCYDNFEPMKFIGINRIDGCPIFKEYGEIIKKQRIYVSSLHSLINEISTRMFNSFDLVVTIGVRKNGSILLNSNRGIWELYITKSILVNGDNLNFMNDVEI